MCDYSLMHVDNRLAEKGENLTTHRFGTGAIGLISAADHSRLSTWQAAQRTPKDSIARNLAGANAPTLCAICVPPGAELTLNNIPLIIQQQNGVKATERVTFDQLSARINNYRDAFRFSNGRAVLIQNFGTGVQAKVMSMEHATEREAVEEFAFAAR